MELSWSSIACFSFVLAVIFSLIFFSFANLISLFIFLCFFHSIRCALFCVYWFASKQWENLRGDQNPLCGYAHIEPRFIGTWKHKEARRRAMLTWNRMELEERENVVQGLVRAGIKSEICGIYFHRKNSLFCYSFSLSRLVGITAKEEGEKGEFNNP